MARDPNHVGLLLIFIILMLVIDYALRHVSLLLVDTGWALLLVYGLTLMMREALHQLRSVRAGR